MFKINLKKVTLVAVTVLLFLTSIPLSAISNEMNQNSNMVLSYVDNNKQVYANEAFEVEINNSEDDNKILLEVPKELQVVSISDTEATYTENRITIDSLGEKVISFIAPEPGELTIDYVNTIDNEVKQLVVIAEERSSDTVEDVIEEEPEEEIKDVEEPKEELEPTSRESTFNSGLEFQMTTTTEKFQTYRDPQTNISPSDLRVQMTVTSTLANQENLKAEVSLEGYMPTKKTETFKHFEMTEDIFDIVDPVASPTSQLFESFEVDRDRNVLIINFKKTPSTSVMETVTLVFNYNQNYLGKIPANQVIWDGIDILVSNADNKVQEINQNNFKVTSSVTNTGIAVEINKRIPIAQDVTTDVVTFSGVFRNDRREFSHLDETYDNLMYIEIPKELEVANLSSLRNFKKPTAYTEEVGEYIRYYYPFASEPSDWYYWTYSGNENTTYDPNTIEIGGFDSLPIDTKVQIAIGMIYKKENSVSQEVRREVNYVTREKKDFDLYTYRFHTTYGPTTQIINTSVPGALANSPRPVYIGLESYEAAQANKNLGEKPIKNVKLTLDVDDSKTEILRVHNPKAIFDVEGSSIEYPYYKTIVYIKNANTGHVEKHESEVVQAVNLKATGNNIALPELSDHEFVSKIELIPMGEDGKNPGEWMPKTSMSLAYHVKNWEDGKWPDGTDIDLNKVYQTYSAAYLEYLDEKNPDNRVMRTFNHPQFRAYYASSNSTDASARLVSGSSSSLAPGEIVNYNILGYNGNATVSEYWKNPEITIQLPKNLELYDYSDLKIIDSKSSNTVSDAVRARRIGYDDDYNYYRLNLTYDAPKNGANVSFEVPIQFKVVAGAEAGSFDIPSLVLSGENFSQMNKETNTLEDAAAEKFGYDNNIDTYYVSERSNTNYNIQALNSLESETAARPTKTGSWTRTEYFGVEKNSEPQLQVSIRNKGNSTLEKTRLYQVLPKPGDINGSTGNITFEGIEVAGSVVYYSTLPSSQLPKHNAVSLSTWTTTTLNKYGFSTTPPADLSDVTAIYVDLGSQDILPGKALNAVLNFRVPNADDQIAKIEFAYTSTVKDTNITLDLVSSMVTFSTEVAQVVFEPQLPENTESEISNLPEEMSITEVLDSSKKATITLPTNIPQLEGYTFKHWKDVDTGKTYDPKETIYFNKKVEPKTNLILATVWEPNTYTVKFNSNTGVGTMEDQEFTYDVAQALHENKFTKGGYSFQGWATAPNGTVVLGDNDEAKNLRSENNSEITLYAIWGQNQYSVKFDSNGGEGNMPNQVITFDELVALNENKFTKEGYHFVGWSEVKDGPKVYDDKHKVENLVSQGTKTLYAKWEANTYNIVFDSMGAQGNMPNQSMVYGSPLALSANAYTKAGHKFVGWATEKNGVKIYNDKDVVDFLTDDKAIVTLYAVWTTGEYEIVDGYLFQYNPYYSIKLVDYPYTDALKIAEAEDVDHGNVKVTKIEDGSNQAVTYDFTNYKEDYGDQSYTFEFYTGERFVTKTITVSVTDNNEDIGSHILVADDVVLGKKDAQALVPNFNQQIVSLANARAVSKTDDSVTPLSFVSVDPAYTGEVGVYTVTYKFTTGDTITSKLTVIDFDDVVTVGNYVIAANNFVIGRSDIANNKLNLKERANAKVFKKTDLTTDLGANTDTVLIADGDATQTVTFRPTRLDLIDVLSIDVTATLKSGQVIDGDNYVLVVKDEIEIQINEAQTYITQGHGTDNSIIQKADAKAYHKDDLNTEAGTVIFSAHTFKEKENGTATFVVEEDSKANAVVNVKVKTDTAAPVVTVDDNYKNVKIPLNGNFDYKEGVTAKDIENPSNEINFEKGNLVAEGQNFDRSVEGVHTIKYTATDKNGIKSEPAYKVVIVSNDEVPVIGDYYIVAQNIMAKVDEFTNSDASNKAKLLSLSNAYAVNKNTGEKVGVVVSDLNGFTNKVGEYVVKLKVEGQDSGLLESTDLRVVLTDGDIVVGDQYMITAINKTVGKNRAQLIVDDQTNGVLFSDMKVYAVHRTNAKEVLNKDIKVNNRIENSEAQSRKMTFTVKADASASIEKTLKVVDEDDIENNGNLFIGANDFVIGRESISGLSNDDYIKYAGARAWNDESDASLTVEVKTKLNASNPETRQQVTYKIVNENVEITVWATILDGESVIGENYVLVGKDFSISGSDAKVLMDHPNDESKDSILLDNPSASLVAYKRKSTTEAGTVVVSDRSAIKNEGNENGYTTKFKVKNEQNVVEDTPELSLQVYVNMGNAPVLNVKKHSVIEVGQAFDPSSAFIGGSALNDGITELKYSDLDQDLITSNVDTSTVGIYTVTYKYVDSYGLEATAKHTVAVNDGSIEVTDKYVIYAKNVVLTREEASSNVEENIKTKAEPVVYLISTGTRVDDSLVSVLRGDVESAEGSYTAYIKVKDETQTKPIKVIVTGGEIIEGDKHYLITANKETIGLKTAQQIIDDSSDTLIQELMDVYAIHKTSLETVLPEGIKVDNNITEAKAQEREVQFTVKVDPKATTTAMLKVLDDKDVVNEGDIYIAANPFVIGRNNIQNMTLQDYVNYSNVRAWNDLTQEKLSVEVKTPIDPSPTAAAKQNVTFKVVGHPVEVTVEVQIVDGDTVIGENYIISGKDFSITGSAAKQLEENPNDTEADKLLLENTSANIRVYAKYSLELASEAVVVDRSQIKNQVTETGYNTVFAVKDEMETKLPLKVFVDKGEAPRISVHKTSQLPLGGTFDPKAQFIGGVAKNDNLENITFEDLKPEWITGVSDIDVNKVGIYDVEYKYIDSYDLVATAKHLVIVNDDSIQETDKYVIYGENVVLQLDEVDYNVEQTIKAKSKPYAYNIDTGEEVDPQLISIDKGSVIAKEGLYVAHIRVDGDNTTKDIQVLVTNDEISIGDEFKISAADTKISVDDAALSDDQLKALIIEKSRAKAIHITSQTPAKVEVNHNIEVTPGMYDATYYVNKVDGSGVDVSTKKKVEVVDDKFIDNDNDVYISANPFVVAKKDVAGLSDAQYASLAKAKAWNDKDTSSVYTAIPANKLDANKSETQYIKFVVKKNAETLERPTVTVPVLVLDGDVIEGNTHTLVGHDFTITGAQATEIIKSENNEFDHYLLDGGDLVSYLNKSIVKDGTPFVVDKSKLDNKEGTYTVKFGVEKDGVKLENPILELNVTVSMSKAPRLDVEENSTLTVGQNFNAQSKFKYGYDYSANKELTFDDLVFDDSGFDKDTVGIYTVTYSYTDSSDQTTTKSHIIAVTDGSIVEEDGYFIYGENAVVTMSEIKNRNENELNNLIRPKVNPVVIDAVTGKQIADQDVTIEGYSKIKEVIGEYTLTIKVKGSDASKDVTVHVVNGDVIEGDKYILVVNNTTITHKEAVSTNLEDLVIKRSKAQAISRTSQALGNVAADVSKIKAVVGDYDVKYHVVEEPTLKETAQVSVTNDDYIGEDQDVYISAKPFVVGKNDISAMNNEASYATYINLAKAHAFSEDVAGPFTIKVDESTKLTETLGSQKVTYYVAEYPKAKVVVDVLVTDGGSIVGDKYTIVAKDFRTSAAKAQEVIDGEADESNVIFGSDMADVKVFENNSLTQLDKAVTFNKEALLASSGEYIMIFTVVDDAKAKISIKATVSQGNLPILTIGEQRVNINTPETYDESFDVKLEDKNGGGILTLNFVDRLQDLESGGDIYADKSQLDLTQLGMYVVNYTALDNNFNKVEGKQLVIVHDGNVIEVDDYYIFADNVVLEYAQDVKAKTDAQIISKILAETHGYAIHKTSLDRKSIVIPKLGDDFIKDESINTVEVQVEGVETAKTDILVTVTRGKVVVGDKYVLSYSDAYTTVEEFSAIPNSKVTEFIILRANAKATPINGGVMGTVTLSGNVPPIKGRYDVVFGVSEESSLTGDAQVIIKDHDEIVEVDDYVITASNFPIGILDIDKFNEAQYVSLAHAEVENKITKETFAPKLDNRPLAEVGKQDVTFSSNKADDLKITVLADVYDGHVIVEDDYFIKAVPVEITVEEAIDVVSDIEAGDDTSIKQLAEVEAYRVSNHETLTTSLVEGSSTIEAKAGDYSVTFKVDDRTTLTIDVSVNVDKGVDPTLTVPEYIETTVDSTTYDNLEGVSAFDNNLGVEISQSLIDVVDTTDLTTAGVYTVTYTVVDANLNKVVKTVAVIVNDGSFEIVDDYIFRAKNFVINTNDVNSGSGANPQIIERSEASAYNYVTHKAVESYDLIVKDNKGYSRTVGLYEGIVLGVRNETVEKTIDAEVTAKHVVVGDLYTISAKATSVGQFDARNMTPTDMMERMNVEVSKRVDGIADGIPQVDNYDTYSTTPNTYEMIFSVVQEPKTKTKDSITVLDRDDVIIDGAYMIAANRFYIGYDDIDETTPEQLVAMADAYATRTVNNNTTQVPVRWISGPEKAIGADKPVVFAVNENIDVKVETSATVLGGNVVQGDEYYINSEFASRPISDLKEVQKGNLDIRTIMNAKVYRKDQNPNLPVPEVQVRTNIAELDPIKTTYDITFYFVEDGVEYDVTSKLQLNEGNAPKISVAKVQNINIKNNDVYDKYLGLVMSDDEDDNNSNAPSLVAVLRGHEVVERAIANKKIGVYTVKYSVEDYDGNISHAYQTVVINDGSIEIGDDYALEGHNFYIHRDDVRGTKAEVLELSGAKAYKLGSENELGNVLVDLNGYKNQVGDYTIGLSVEEELTTSKDIEAHVTKDNVNTGDDYIITAAPAYISIKDVDSLDEDKLIALTKVKAEDKRLGVGANVELVRSDVQNSVGTFDVEFMVSSEPDTKITTSVHVLEFNHVLMNDDYVIVGNDFYVGKDDIKAGISETEYIALSKAASFNRYDESLTYEIEMDETTTPVDVSRDVDFFVSQHPLTRVKVTAHILDGNVVQGDKYYIKAEDTTIFVSEADKALKGELSFVDLASAFAEDYDNNPATVVVDHHNIEAKHGTYSIVFMVEDERETKVEVTINVDKGLAPELTVPEFSEITLGSDFDYMLDVLALDDRDGNITNLVTVDETVDVDHVGVYELEYSVVDSDFNETKQKTYVVVNDGSIVIEDGYIIEAQNFMINYKEALGTHEEIITHSQAKAYDIENNTEVEVIVSNDDEYSNIKGIYNIELAVKDKPSVVMSIVAEVVNGEVIVGEDYYLTANDITLGIEDAVDFDEQMMIERSQAHAIHKTLGTEGTVIVDATNFAVKPGAYSVTYKVVQDDTSITKGIEVLDDDNVVETDDYVIMANNFMIGDKFILEMTKKDIVALANVRAYNKANPEELLEVTQVEDIITTVGDHTVTFMIVEHSDIQVKVNKTIFKDTLYYIDAHDGEIKISDLTRAVNTGNLDATIVDITGAKGYLVNGDGSKQDMPVYVSNKNELIGAKTGQRANVRLSLADPENRTAISDANDSETHRIENANTSVSVIVDADPDTSKDPATGIETVAPMLYVLILLISSIVLLITLKFKRKRA